MAQNLNRGILSRKAAPLWGSIADATDQQEPEIIMVPLWKAIAVTIGLLWMTASFVYSVRPEAQFITKVQQVPVDHPVPTCDAPLALAKSRAFHGMQKQLAAAIPASALKHWGK